MYVFLFLPFTVVGTKIIRFN